VIQLVAFDEPEVAIDRPERIDRVLDERVQARVAQAEPRLRPTPLDDPPEFDAKDLDMPGVVVVVATGPPPR
jgi:hypothetical protein